MNLSSVVLDLLLNVIVCSAKSPVALHYNILRQIVDEMRDQPWRTWSIDELTSRTGLSPSTLRTRFKALTGLSPHGYLVSCRIQRAKEGLARGGTSIAELALSLGFVSARHFSSAFKLATGLSPRQWVRANA